MAGSGGSRALHLLRRFLRSHRNFTTNTSVKNAAKSDVKKTAEVKPASAEEIRLLDEISIFKTIDDAVENILPPKIRYLWNHPAGFKTIHFWAPTFKWCLVFAGMADYARPPERLSPRQSGALAATGVIWSRYSMVVIPKNYNLFSVNFFLALTGIAQLSRIILYRRSVAEKKREREEQLAARKGADKSRDSNNTTKAGVSFGPPVVSEPGEGFGPPGTGPPKGKYLEYRAQQLLQKQK